MILFTRLKQAKYILFIVALSFASYSSACSMYKITLEGKTVIGNNEDAWRTTPHLWFEVGMNGEYGCCFTGSRHIGNNKYAAQSGMNEHGLTFSRLTSYHPEQNTNAKTQLKLIENPDQFLMKVLRTCKNIDEVYALLNEYNRSCFLEDVFVYVEPSGEYLVVEPYQLIRGIDPTYVQANFCPSIMKESGRRRQERYRKGRDFLNNKTDTSLAFCTSVSDQMHVCRAKIGDGTLLTSIWNTSQLSFTVFLYHDYSSGISFNLLEELAKGNHQIELKSIFPINNEFEALSSYITPFNTPWLRIVMALVGVFLLMSSMFFLITAIKSKRRGQSMALQITLAFTFLLGFCYLFLLASTIEIYYFPAPYNAHLVWKTMASYIPYLLFILVILIGFLYWKKSTKVKWSILSKGVLFLNTIAFTFLFIGFFYWKLL